MLAEAAESALRLYGRVAPTGRGMFRLGRLVRRLRPRDAWRGEFRTLWGFRIEADLATYPDVCMAHGVYELATARLIHRLLGPGDHFVDCGANLGYFTLLAAQRVGAAGRVDAIEAQPDNYARLRANLQRNGVDQRVHAHPLAVADREGVAQIHMVTTEGHNHGESSLFAAPGLQTRAAEVRTVRLDALLGGTRPRLIKMDIEGAEPLALRGAAGLLAVDQPPTLLLEQNATKLEAAGFEPAAMMRAVLGAQPRYRFLQMDRRMQPITPDAPGLAGLGTVNLLAVAE